MCPLPVSDLFFCGRATVEKLHRLGIQTMITHEANKGYGNSLTAPVDIVTEDYAKHLLLSLCETVGTRLRSAGVTVRVASVHLTTYEFQHMGKQMQLDSPTNITKEIYEVACGILDKLWDTYERRAG